MASLFVIREKNSNTFCTGQRFRHFDSELQSAAMFKSKANAEKAIKSMFSGFACSTWQVNNQTVFNGDLQDYLNKLRNSVNARTLQDHIKYLEDTVPERKAEMEAVEVKLTLV